MLNHFLVTAFRNFSRNKFYVLINIIGLAIGVGAFLLLGAYVQSEWAYDNFHERGDRIYRVVETQRLPGVEEMDVAVTMPPLAPRLKENFPGIETVTRILNGGTQTWKYEGQTYSQDGFIYADSTFFEIFTFPLISGDSKTALKDPYSVVLGKSVANRIFGNQDPVGKQLPVIWNGREYPFQVTGVMQDVPNQSHLQFTMVASMRTYESFGNDFDRMWGNSMGTYLLLNEQADPQSLEAQFPDFLDQILPANSGWREDRLDLYLQPVSEVHLQSNHIKYQVQNYQQGDLSSIYIFGFVSILIIIVACINYMNLATARSVKRSGEVGIRKVFGSRKEGLILQFLVESVIIAGLSTLAGLGLAYYLMPYFQEVMNLETPLTLFSTQTLALQIIGISLLVGILAGSYPAFVLSSFRPADIIRGNYYHTGGGGNLRKILVGAQFIVVVVLLILSGFVWNQMRYVSNKDMGFSQESVLFVPVQSRQHRNSLPLLKQELSRINGVESVSASSSRTPSGNGDRTIEIPGENPPRKLLVRNTVVDIDYPETLKMEIIAGRSFSPEVGADTVSSVLVNEALVERLGWDDPVGRQIQWGSGESLSVHNVIGVIKNFHYFSFREAIDPLIMRARRSAFPYILIRLDPNRIEAALPELQAAWQNLLPGESFDYRFMDDHFATYYQSDRNYGKLISSFSALAIIIACLGLMGIATFMAEQKTKEIGIRKVLGSSIGEIIHLINKPFLRLVGIAILIAIPLGYWLGSRWLEIFRYHQQPGLWIYLGAALIVVGISYLTVSFQAYKAATINPIEALQRE